MKKHFDYYTILVVILCIIVILAFVAMMANAVWATASDAEVHVIMEEAQEHIDRYETALVPAVELPVVFPVEPVEVEEPVEDWYIESVPLDKPLQKAVFDAACESGVDYFTALGLIQVESNFQLDAVSPCGSYGLCQLNPAWFPSGLSPEENVRAGMEYLGQLIEGHNGDVPAALRAYNLGYDDGARGYPYAVLSSAEDIMRQAGVAFP